MGARGDDTDSYLVHAPLHEVVIRQPFILSRTPVTQSDWEGVMKRNPSSAKGEARPVEMVSWYEAVLYCNELSKSEELEEVYRLENPRGQPWEEGFTANVAWQGLSCPGYRLPTEAEWEHACRAGTETSRYGELDDVAWWQRNSSGATRPVGLKEPNAWGIHDILGTVWEWCHDWFADYPTARTTDHTGPEDGTYRVVRGGSWDNSATFINAGYRRCEPPGYRHNSCGFRVARSLS